MMPNSAYAGFFGGYKSEYEARKACHSWKNKTNKEFGSDFAYCVNEKTTKTLLGLFEESEGTFGGKVMKRFKY